MLLSTIIRSQYLSPHPLWVVSSSAYCLTASLSRHHALTSPTRHSLSYPPTSATMPHATYPTMASLHIIEKTIILALFSPPLPKSAHVLPTMRLLKPLSSLLTPYQSTTYHFGLRPHEGQKSSNTTFGSRKRQGQKAKERIPRTIKPLQQVKPLQQAQSHKRSHKRSLVCVKFMENNNIFFRISSCHNFLLSLTNPFIGQLIPKTNIQTNSFGLTPVIFVTT